MRTALPTGPSRRDGPPSHRDGMRWVALAELITGSSALAGGALLAIRPDGSMLGIPATALASSPFTTWRAPGMLLATLVGGGGILTGWSVLRGARLARPASVCFGVGLAGFEAVEAHWVGLHPLQAVFAAIGVTVVVRALAGPPPAQQANAPVNPARRPS